MWRKSRDRVQAELQREIDRLGALIGASGMQLAGFDPGIDAGYPFIAIDAKGELDLIVKERGTVLRQDRARNADEVLFWAFESTTHTLASTWSAQHRGDRDFRTVLWAKQAKLLWRLHPEWARRWRAELEARQPDDVHLMPDVPD